MADYATSGTNDYLDQINRQKQTQYAAQNGMNLSSAVQGQTDPQKAALDGALSAGTGSGQTADFASATQNRAAATSTNQPAQQAAPQPTSSPTATGVSPVTGDGKINEANVPPPAPMQAPAMPMTDPFAAIGGGVQLPDGGWVPRNHPLAAPYLQPAQAPAAMASPLAAAWTPAGAPQAGSIGAQSPATIFRDGAGMPIRQATSDYNPGTLSQYGGGINTALETAAQDALMKALATGGGLPTELLKGQIRDDAMAMRDNELAAARDHMAGSGRLGGGFDLATQGGIREKALENILGGYRDVGIQDALARNQFGLQGASAANDFLTGQQGRLQSDFQTRLGGQLAQEELLLKGAGNSRDNYLADLQGFLGKYGADKSAESAGNVANIGANADITRAKYGLLGDVLNIMERARATDMGTAADWGRIQASILGGL